MKKRMPKDLQISPMSFDTQLAVVDPGSETTWPEIHVKIGHASGGAVVTKQEALAIAKWFNKLAGAAQ